MEAAACFVLFILLSGSLPVSSVRSCVHLLSRGRRE